jgi:hypothetical protein
MIIQVLQGFAQECKSRISKPVSILRVAACCTVLRSRWCQSGVKRSWITHRRFLCKPDAAGARGSAESTRRRSDERRLPPSTLPRSIHQGGYPCRANICSVDHHARARRGAVSRFHRIGAMRDPASGLRRTLLPRTRLNKGMKKGRGIAAPARRIGSYLLSG